jgi:hypothetical protein
MRRRGFVLALAGSAALASGAAAGAPPAPIAPSSAVTATLSSPRPAARPVRLALSFDTSLVCGRPLGPTTITFPAAAHVPGTIARTAVLVDGRPAGTVAVAGPRVTVTSVTPTGMMCHTVAIGPMAIEFTTAAGLGNPSRAGSYGVTVQRGRRTLHGRLTIAG